LNDIQPENEDTTLHLRLSPEEVAELDTIVGWMERDPKIRRLRARLGREKAVRYAIGYLVENPPEHAKGG
jgi:hypothetical protein